jgi:hypothetical protein
VLEHDGYAAADPKSGSLFELNTLREYVSKTRSHDLSITGTLREGLSIIQSSGNRGSHATSFQQHTSLAAQSNPDGNAHVVGAKHAGAHLCDLVRWAFALVEQPSRCPNIALAQIESGRAEPPKRLLLSALPWVLSACCLVSLAWVLSREHMMRDQSTPHNASTVHEHTESSVAQPAPEPLVTADAGAPPSRIVRAVVCPDEMLQLTLQSRHVAPPVRTAAALAAGVGAWREGLQAADTGTFDVCVDRRPVSKRAFESFLAGLEQAPSSGIRQAQDGNRACRQRPQDASQGCVPLREARAFCAAMHEATEEFDAGEVPSVAFWEALRGAPQQLALLAPEPPAGTDSAAQAHASIYLNEWAGDRGARSLWHGLRAEYRSHGFWRTASTLKPPGAVTFGWTATEQPRDEQLAAPSNVVRNETIGFRCLVRRRR